VEQVSLSQEQLALFKYIEGEHTNIFVTGRAGTGKSTLLSYLVENTKKNFAVCAPTGVAALNVNGQTIHSLFGLPPGLLGTEDVARHLSKRSREVLRSIEMLVIDEISMVSADLLDAMNRMLIAARGRNRGPFGGAQVVMFGDPYQLAPVPPSDPAERGWLAENYQSNWFFDAHVWRDADLERYELNEIFRQHDDEFKSILNAIRDGSCTQEMLDRLNQAGNRFAPHDDVIRLCTINANVDQINGTRLSRLGTSPKQFQARFASGDAQSFGRALPVELSLVLKEGAQVMFVKNDDQSNRKTKDGLTVRRWVNGTIGHVVQIHNENHVSVEVDGEVMDVGISTWEKIRYEVEEEFDDATGKFKEVLVPITLAEYQQIPLRLAWAVTVHKSQGQTYEEVIIDMGRGAFSPGQTYVALSRVRSLEGLYLTRAINMRDILVDDDVLRFMGAKPNAALERLI
jgi:ATP-dependent exoDNAse (exonuclease V) alpha subunit